MAGTREDIKTQELNLMLKSLGKRGKEGENWKEFTENVVFYTLRRLSELLSKKSKRCIVLRPYGSAAEDFKCLEPVDVGDADIMIFPNSDRLMIYDERIEYLSNHPLHVRIKGADHPVLQSCLVEDTECVANAAIKKFHPAIFGRFAPHLAEAINLGLQVSTHQFSSILQSTCRLRNNADSPATTLNFVQSVKDPQDVTNIYAAQWEWLVHHLSRTNETVYSGEHNEILNVISRFADEVLTTVKGVSNVFKIFPVLEEYYWSDRGQNLALQFRDIERQYRIERRRRVKLRSMETAFYGYDKRCVTPERSHEEGSARHNLIGSQDISASSNGSYVLQQNDTVTKRCAEDLESTSIQSARDEPENCGEFCAKKPMPKETNEKSGDGINRGEENRDGTTSDHQRDSKVQVQFLTKEELPRNFGNIEEPTNRHLRRGIAFLKPCLEKLAKGATETKKECSEEKKFKHTDKGHPNQQVGGIDVIPAFRSPGWPKVAQEWIGRKRKWPSPDIVDRVVQEGFHLVVKSPKNGGNPDCDFRISFSHAECLLSQEMNDIQRECYRCLKKYHRAYLSTKAKSLVTFHLKNIFLQTIEETGAEMWTESNIAECMMKLLWNLLEALRKKDLRHFFVRSYNLFCADYIENSDNLKSLAGRVWQIMENPMEFAKALINN